LDSEKNCTVFQKDVEDLSKEWRNPSKEKKAIMTEKQ
jgi:hypothetical protein